MSEFKTLQNLTDRPLPIIFDGEQYCIGPRGAPDQSVTLPARVADYAKGQLGSFVAELSEQSPVSYIAPSLENNMWLANMTGDPDAATEFVIGRKKSKETGEYADVKVANENFGAQILSETVGQSHQIYEGYAELGGVQVGQYGSNSRTVLGKEVRIMPFQRVQVSRVIGSELLKRDRQRPLLQQGKVVEAAPPAKFEPKMNWPLDQKRAWLELVEPSYRRNPHLLGPTEAEIRESNPDLADQLVAEANQKMFQRCFLRMVRPETTKPSEKDFEIYTSAQKKLRKAIDKAG